MHSAPFMPASKNRWLETLVLVSLVASLLAPGLLGPALVALLGATWLWHWSNRRERWLLGVLLLLSVALLTYGREYERAAFDPARKARAIEREFASIWGELDLTARQAAEALGRMPQDERRALASFERLAGQARSHNQRLTLLSIGEDGAPEAWSGPGLLHDLEREPLPALGRSFRLGFQAATVFSVAEVPDGGGARVVAGRSLFTNDLPRRDRFLGPIRWTVFHAGDVVPPELIEIDIGAGPAIAVENWEGRPAAGDAWESRARRWGSVVLALALLALASLRTIAGRGQAGQSATLLAAAAIAAGLAARLSPVVLAPLAAAAFLATLVWWRPAVLERWLPPAWARALLGGSAVMAVAFAAQRFETGLDLGSELFPGHQANAWRLSIAGLTLAWLGLVGRVRADKTVDDSAAANSTGAVGWGASAVVLLLAAGALHDQPAAFVPAMLLVAGTVVAGLWAERQARPLTLATGSILILLAALIAAVGWEMTSRQNLKHHLKSVVLPGLARPAPGELQLLRQGLDRHFSELDLGSVVLPNPAGLEVQDLGIAVWSGSPLAVRGALSAVTVWPFDGGHASFSLGLPLTNEGEVDWSPTRWRKVEEPSPEGSLLTGATQFLHDGRPWADVSYTLLMRPGFGLSRRPLRSLATVLLQGAPGPFRPDPKLIEPASYGLYSPDGEAVEVAWPGVTLPLARLIAEPGSVVVGPEGRAVGFAAEGPDGIQVLLLPVLGPVAALERAAMHAVATLVLLGLGLLIGWAFGLPTLPSRRAISGIWRSYSKRMLLVSGLLLVVPVLLLNTFALRVLTDQLRNEQRLAGEAALDTAQRVLGEYILALDPGFGIETILDDELLSWLARVIHHEITLYWGSSVYVSSKSELFSAGLLPKRIPGEIYASLALDGATRAARVNRTGDIDYLELYAPLSIPGQPSAQSGIFLSVPMLAQQVETAAELASLRRKVLLATAALVLLLMAVGSRLARGFTSPLMEIVDGTQRIAAGARSIDLRPGDQELETLVDAIDLMAQKIADGRARLEREKALIERVVDNVNSGVVSVDQDRSVLLINQVARDLLGAEIGDSLPDVLAGREWLAPIADFLGSAGADRRVETVQLPVAEGGGEGTEWTLAWVPLPHEGAPTALLVVEDVTEVLRGQRLQAWAEMARIIAHEIKNPLTPIRLSTEHMRKVRTERPEEFEAVFERCTANILVQVEELRQISSEFSAYSRLPKIEPIPGDLGSTVREIVEGYQASNPEGVLLEIDPRVDRTGARFDAKLIGRALRNLIENAVRATANGRGVEVTVGSDNRRVSIRVLDRGPGVSPDNLARIFEPYFSTHDTGTGLGLPIARRIAEEHGGGVHARNRDGGGLEVELWIPANA